jgi:phenylalanyl-tRNA synthetase alpha chain
MIPDTSEEWEILRKLTLNRPQMERLVDEVYETLRCCETVDQLEEARLRLLGKKGPVAELFGQIGQLPEEDKKPAGRIGNTLKSVIKSEIDSRISDLGRMDEAGQGVTGVDITLPGRKNPLGHHHVISQVTEEIVSIFIGLGYQVVSGPEVELDYYNFEALNQPPFHPARSLQDTLYVTRKHEEGDDPDDIVLRTHTSPVQVRVMESRSPPLYVVSPGRCYRRDEVDATHSAMFHQVEGFAVDIDINMGHLKGSLEVFARKFFGADREVRFRPHFFPFTEPSAEMDVSCFACDGNGCRLCKGSGWLEILGCGMIDPNVFAYVGYDPEEFSGFAFGMGVDRIAMMRYGIDDIRILFENDVRFLRQF